VVQRIVSALGGTINVESELARGSCFMLRLPTAEYVGTPYRETTVAPEPVASVEG